MSLSQRGYYFYPQLEIDQVIVDEFSGIPDEVILKLGEKFMNTEERMRAETEDHVDSKHSVTLAQEEIRDTIAKVRPIMQALKEDFATTMDHMESPSVKKIVTTAYETYWHTIQRCLKDIPFCSVDDDLVKARKEIDQWIIDLLAQFKYYLKMRGTLPYNHNNNTYVNLFEEIVAPNFYSKFEAVEELIGMHVIADLTEDEAGEEAEDELPF